MELYRCDFLTKCVPRIRGFSGRSHDFHAFNPSTENGVSTLVHRKRSDEFLGGFKSLWSGMNAWRKGGGKGIFSVHEPFLNHLIHFHFLNSLLIHSWQFCWRPFWGSEKSDPKSKANRDLQRSQIERSRLESPGLYYFESFDTIYNFNGPLTHLYCWWKKCCTTWDV